MKINLNTNINKINSSFEVRSFWDTKLVDKYNQFYDGYSPFAHRNKLPTWEKMKQMRVNEVFSKITDFFRDETYEFKDKDVELKPSNYLSVKMLDILSKDGVDITDVFKTTYQNDLENKSGWQYQEFIDLYLSYLKFKGQLFPTELLDPTLKLIKEYNGYISNSNTDNNVSIYFKLIDRLPKEKVTYSWFAEHLNIFCSSEDDNSGEIVNKHQSLNYDTQKLIYDYIEKNFPEYLEENSKYYLKLIPTDIFTSQSLHQGVININLFQIIHNNNLKQKDSDHLCNIARHCLSVVNSSDFMGLIEKDIHVSHINIEKTQSNITLKFSSESSEELEEFKTILLTALKGVLNVSEKIRLNWNSLYNGEDKLDTNMDAKFVHQHYLFHDLHNSLNTSKQQNKKHKL